MRRVFKRYLWGYVGRFTLVHVVTYIALGIIFMNLQNYEEVFRISDKFANFRPIDSTIVKLAPLLQVLRGGFFSLLLYPFYQTIVNQKLGWLYLFGILWGLTGIGSVAATPGSIEGIIYTKASLAEHLIGLPEVTLQMLIFSWLFVAWERKSQRHK